MLVLTAALQWHTMQRSVMSVQQRGSAGWLAYRLVEQKQRCLTMPEGARSGGQTLLSLDRRE